MLGIELYKLILRDKPKYVGRTYIVERGHNYVRDCKFKVFEDADNGLINLKLIDKPYPGSINSGLLMNLFLQSDVGEEIVGKGYPANHNRYTKEGNKQALLDNLAWIKESLEANGAIDETDIEHLIRNANAYNYYHEQPQEEEHE